MATPLFSSSLADLDQTCIWHPFTQAKTARPPIPIIRAEGVYLYAEGGKRYLDAISSWWVNLHGHAHPYIALRIAAQADVLEHVMFAGFTHAPAVELALRLLPLLPGAMAKIFYSDNGSTAVESALKMAIQYWHNQNIDRTQVICFRHGYHGDTFGAMAAAGKNHLNRPFWKHLFDVAMFDPPMQGQEERSLAQLQLILEEQKAACFIFEPLVLASGGMRIYPPQGLDPLIRCCKEAGVLTIADEVMTGFGRTGPLFACQALEESPDVICLSKGITGGFLPLGVTACTEAVFSAFLSEKRESALLHGHSYTANPLACCSALASLDLLLRPACALQREEIEASHRNFCLQWGSHPKLKRSEVLGTLLVLEFHSVTSSYFDPLSDRLHNFFLDRGILVRPLGNVIYLLPPYCIQREELQWIYDHIILALEEDL